MILNIMISRIQDLILSGLLSSSALLVMAYHFFTNDIVVSRYRSSSRPQPTHAVIEPEQT
jgi:hypothetical protein